MGKRICVECGKEFEPRKGGKEKICSPECKVKRRARQCKSATKKYEKKLRERGKRAPEEKSCAICGQLFKPKDIRSMACSDECRRIYRNEQYRKKYNEQLRAEKQFKEQQQSDKEVRESHIEEKAAEARRRGISYGQLIAEETLRKVGKIDINMCARVGK